jgi:non-heme chloroperoxidase
VPARNHDHRPAGHQAVGLVPGDGRNLLIGQGHRDSLTYLPAFLTDVRSVLIAGGPHAIIWTHADEVNQALLQFIG